jgi:hypothetical protein
MMREILTFTGFMLQLILLTFVVAACYAGLFVITRAHSACYRNQRPLLKSHAIQWGVRMAVYTYLVIAVLSLLVSNGGEAWWPFLERNAELFLLSLLVIGVVFLLGILASVFTLLDD